MHRTSFAYDLKHQILYLLALIKDVRVATLSPSSRFLRNRVLNKIDFTRAHLIVEYGAGGGVITREILRRMKKDSRLLAIEVNPILVKELKRIVDPRLRILEGDVRRIDPRAYLNGYKGVDVIVSGIPFSLLKSNDKHDVLKTIHGCLNPGGKFIAYQCHTYVRDYLKEYFGRVHTEFELFNVPPHFVYECVKIS